MDRRQFVMTSSGVAAAGMAAGQAAAMATTPASATPAPSSTAWGAWETDLKGAFLDLTKPQDQATALARLDANTDMTSTKFGWGTGIVQGVVPGEGVRDLVGFELLSTAKLIPYQGPELPDGMVGYSKVLREIGLYTDLETGEILEEWVNPYFNEKQKVVPIANDPFNTHTTPFAPKGPEYGGLRPLSAEEDAPLDLKFARKGDMLHLYRHINLFYPSALQPEKWPRENGNEFNQVTERFAYQIPWADMQNPNIGSVTYHGTWSRTTPWLPWMLMGKTEGHIAYSIFMGAVDSIEQVNPKVVEYVAAKYPKYLVAPEKWEEPSWSSLEWYAKEQTPAPVVAGQEAPVYTPKPLPAWWPAAKA
ncbi:MAG: DUF1838 family protein, partial [Pseudomonadota bacterium]